eukprot:TRINITY_DN2912_c0_g3_i1.p1 TRINITY_DN2912_c0_g3~~TRINITY_DN2912_c0_g3_i1.p1  ORF type:complete len:520 (+),score=108.42 TRINITY_DN2912_c0_g3_i1:184-1743(+)
MAPEPRSDSEHESGAEEERKAPREQIPDAVDHFLGLLNEAIQVRNVQEVHKLYEETFNKLTEKYYKNSKWPNAESVAEQLSIDSPQNNLFIILYKDLYYRHAFTKPNVTYEDRRGAWENYCKLLELFVDDLSSGQTLSVGLPTQWLWDILDEFVYHYQTYCAFRNKTAKAHKENDIAKLRENPSVFETTKVLAYLHQLVEGSLVEEWLKDPSNPEGKAGAFTDELVRQCGYFAMMQLLRVHSLLGDYSCAMKTIALIDFDAEVPYFYKTPACHIALYYYMGFSYMMMRRYADAIRTFSGILVYLSKTSGVNALSVQYDFALKKQDQMYVLLLICVSLCPQPLDDALEKYIRDKHLEKQARLQRGEELCFEELFSYSCPKFVSPAAPDYDNLESFNANEAHQRQLHLFQQEVKQQQALPKIGSYMKLYTSLKMNKLAQLCEMDEDGLRDQLMCVIHKTRQRVRTTGPPIAGEVQPCSDVEFYLDGDMVHINAYKPVRPHGEVFLEHILKFQDILKKMGGA